MSLKKAVLETEPSALMCKLPAAHLNGLPGLNGVPVHPIQLETVHRQEREPLSVVKRLKILLNVSHSSVTVSNFCLNNY